MVYGASKFPFDEGEAVANHRDHWRYGMLRQDPNALLLGVDVSIAAAV